MAVGCCRDTTAYTPPPEASAMASPASAYPSQPHHGTARGVPAAGVTAVGRPAGEEEGSPGDADAAAMPGAAGEDGAAGDAGSGEDGASGEAGSEGAPTAVGPGGDGRPIFPRSRRAVSREWPTSVSSASEEPGRSAGSFARHRATRPRSGSSRAGRSGFSLSTRFTDSAAESASKGWRPVAAKTIAAAQENMSAGCPGASPMRVSGVSGLSAVTGCVVAVEAASRIGASPVPVTRGPSGERSTASGRRPPCTAPV
ncbi:hypothetical protein ABH927_006673 [Planotetraspora sp. GP83]